MDVHETMCMYTLFTTDRFISMSWHVSHRNDLFIRFYSPLPSPWKRPELKFEVYVNHTWNLQAAEDVLQPFTFSSCSESVSLPFDPPTSNTILTLFL